MTISEICSIVSATAAVAAFIVSLRNSFKIKEVKHLANSMKDELVEEVRIASHALGVKDEKDREENTHVSR